MLINRRYVHCTYMFFQLLPGHLVDLTDEGAHVNGSALHQPEQETSAAEPPSAHPSIAAEIAVMPPSQQLGAEAEVAEVPRVQPEIAVGVASKPPRRKTTVKAKKKKSATTKNDVAGSSGARKNGRSANPPAQNVSNEIGIAGPSGVIPRARNNEKHTYGRAKDAKKRKNVVSIPCTTSKKQKNEEPRMVVETAMLDDIQYPTIEV